MTEWLAHARAAGAAGRAARGGPARAPDPEAQARRAARREERVAAGAQELRRWLADLVRRGLSEAQQQSWDFWDQPAARMVDAQASGLASRVRRMASARASGDAWAERVLEEAALLQLLLEAHGRLDALPEATRADVRQLIGWAVPTERVLEGAWVRDEWAVVGQVTVEDDRLRSQRTWLRGAGGADALILAFAPPGAVLEPGLAPGTSIDASLAFYPGAVPLRAVVAERHGEPRPLPGCPGHATVGGRAGGARRGARPQPVARPLAGRARGRAPGPRRRRLGDRRRRGRRARRRAARRGS